MRIALLCSGLGHVVRGHETFARQVFGLLKDEIDITLVKGFGDSTDREIVAPCILRSSPLLASVHPKSNQRWAAAVAEQERQRIEAETFAHAALQPLMAGRFDVVHCLEREVCEIMYRERHLFENPPRLLFSNGGAIPGRQLPPCDAIQEHTEYNLKFSVKGKSFCIPHAVDLDVFRPDVQPLPRQALGIAPGKRVAISVGTICHDHKRMDHLIREFVRLPDWHLLIVGQESPESAQIRELGKNLLGERVSFHSAQHRDLPAYYKAADAFVLGSLFETFGIVYIEAMAMGLPVFCTDHPNQQLIVKRGEFVDMRKDGALAARIAAHTPDSLQALGKAGREIAERCYDLRKLPGQYIDQYSRLAKLPPPLPTWTAADQWRARFSNAWKKMSTLLPAP